MSSQKTSNKNTILFALMVFTIIIASLLSSQQSWAQVYCVEKAGAKLFLKPSDKGKPLWRAPLYTPLMGTGNRIKNMIEVTDMDSKKYWVNKNFLSGKVSCLAVRVKKTLLRTGPGLSYQAAKVKQAGRYEAFVDLGGEDGWTQIQDETGNKSWVNLDQVWKPKNKMRISFEEGK